MTREVDNKARTDTIRDALFYCLISNPLQKIKKAGSDEIVIVLPQSEQKFVVKVREITG